jgi:hypothetical protein
VGSPTIARLLIGLCALAGSALAGQEGERPNALDAAGDPRLRQRVTITAYRTTVRRVLARLEAATGVRLSPASERVGEEPLFLAASQSEGVPLRAVLEMVAETFRCESDTRYGWFWMRRGNAAGATYSLGEDLAAAGATTRALARQREAFMDELAARAKTEVQKGGRPPVLAAVPRSLIAAALQGRPQVIPWTACSPALKEAARWALSGAGGAGPDCRVEVKGQGSGPSLSLTVTFLRQGQGGVGTTYRTREGGRREPGVDPSLGRGALARPLVIRADRARAWREGDWNEVLAEAAAASGVAICSDDYGYLFGWPGSAPGVGGTPSDGPLPRGEPLGLWLSRILERTRSVVSQHGSLGMREFRGSVLLRNHGAAGDDLARPSAATRAWINALRRSPRGHLLTLGEVARLLREVDDLGLHYLRLTAGLADAPRLNVLRGILRLRDHLTPAQHALLAGPGLRWTDLTPQQRTEAVREDLGVAPAVSSWALRNTLPSPTFTLRYEGDKLLLIEQGAGKPPLRRELDVRLRPETEVLRVTLAGS